MRKRYELKEKKVPTSKIVLFIPYVLSAVILVFILKNYKDFSTTTLTAMVTLYTATFAVAGYTHKWYAKKESLANTPKIRLGVMQQLIQLQRDNPDLVIYDKQMIKADADSLTKPLKNDEQKIYENLINEDVTSKISTT